MRTLFEIDTRDYDVSLAPKIRPSVRAIIIKDGRVAMVHSGLYNYYKFPGGGIEANETHEDALIREVREEAGLIDITVKRVAYVAVLPHKPVLIIVYLCQTDSEDVTLSDEHQAYIWADKSDCLQLLPDGIISDFEKNNVFDMLN